MKYLIFIGLGLVSMCAQAEVPSVSVFGVNKNAYYQQTDERVVNYTKSGIFGFVEGTGISSTFPTQPVTMAVHGGTSYTLEYKNNQGFDVDKLRFEQYENGFASEAAMSVLFPDGIYTFTSGENSYQLNLVGSYVDAPLVDFSVGRWVGGQLILTAEQAAADWTITSSPTNANGFREISVYDDNFSFDYQTFVGGFSPSGIVSAVIAGGSLKAGMTYNVEVEFDNVVDYINPDAGELRNGFALYSTTTFISVSVVPEPASGYQILSGLFLMGLTLRRRAVKSRLEPSAA